MGVAPVGDALWASEGYPSGGGGPAECVDNLVDGLKLFHVRLINRQCTKRQVGSDHGFVITELLYRACVL